MSLQLYNRDGQLHSQQREDDAIHFSPDCSSNSWAGNLEDDEDMPEDDIREYISSSNPRLFQRLHALPVSSYDIPMSFHGQRILYRLGQTEAATRSDSKDRALQLTSSDAVEFAIQKPTTKGHPRSVHAATLTTKARKHIAHKINSESISSSCNAY